MAASGLTGQVEGNTHVVAVARFAIKLLEMIKHINEHSFNNFNLRIGKNLKEIFWILYVVFYFFYWKNY